MERLYSITIVTCEADTLEKGLSDWTIQINGTRNGYKRSNKEGAFMAFLPVGSYDSHSNSARKQFLFIYVTLHKLSK